MNSVVKIGLLVIVLGMVSAPVIAQGTTSKPASKPAGDLQAGRDEKVEKFSAGRGIAIVGACFGAGLCAIGGGYAIAHIGSKCIESIARQPEAAGTMFAPMIVSAAMVEGGMLFAIVVCLLGVLGL